MANKIEEFFELKRLLEEKERRLKALEADKDIQNYFRFQEELKALMGKYDMRPADVAKVLGLGAPAGSAKSGGAKRALRVYKNPNTGEVVETRGGNHKVLNAWRKQYGKETVEGWRVQ
ncbi:histone-like nucleoid-structuring protein, MvaT/MvaU family [Hahella sp. SMD15-11]|uniref:Histone-like nucleoid-structuring protein, MvaT/MvaU family n=1 Tax=Thermohahella caldifontis TaxID=3142973 RepID=A0AB39UXL7_9GAMM